MKRSTKALVGASAFALFIGSTMADATAATKTTKKTTTKKPAATTTTAKPAATTAAPTTAAPAATGGADLKVGFINQEGGASGSWPETWAAADAAVKYINEELGGVGGRNIKLIRCTTDGTTASSQKCAQQMVSENVLFVTGGLDTIMATWYPILDAANVPVIGGVPVAAADFNAKNSYQIYAGGATTYPGMATYVIRYLPNARRIGILANDTSGAATAVDQIKKVLEPRGYDIVDVRAPASQTDWLAPFSAVSRTDIVLVLVSTQNCIPVAKARLSQGSTVPMLSVSACYDKNVVSAVGKDGLAGWRVDQKFDDPLGTSADALTYQKVMKKYAPANANVLGFAPPVFSNIMTIYTNALKPLGAGVTTASLVEKIKDPAGGKTFLAGRYQCRAPGAPYAAICSYQTHWTAVVNGDLADPTAFVDLTTVIKGIL